MKTTSLRLTFLVLLTSGLLSCLAPDVMAQDVPDTSATPEPQEISPGMTLSYLCTSNDSATLDARLTFRRDRDVIALENASVEFSVQEGQGQRVLGNALTDSTGDARLKIFIGNGLPANAEGVISYNATFAGQGLYLPASESFQAKPASLKIEFTVVDSVRTVKVTGTQTGKGGVPVPLNGESVKIYVPSLFRPLPIGEITLDDAGTGTMEFPKTLIGDSSGNIVVLAEIEESDLFGNVEARNRVQWAIPKHLIPQERPTRELWTPVAPLWMIITLVILLAGVWAHYVYAVIQMIRIKQSSKVNTFSDRY
jgi:hypothetical protein